MTASEDELIYDWDGGVDAAPPRILLDDETLRDGLQSPSVTQPSLADKLELVRLMERLGIDAADIGFPAASPAAREHVEELARAMTGLRIRPTVAARTLVADIAPVAEIAQRVGAPIEVDAFIGSSAIRQLVETWDLEPMIRTAREAIGFCRRENLPVMFVTEDTTRARPETLRALYRAAMDEGAERVCVADTVGAATPRSTRRVVSFVRDLVDEFGGPVGIDWHGHRDRGLALANALAALEAGAERLHGTALGVGERVGNTEMDLLLVNLKLAGLIDNDLSALPEYCRLAARALDAPLPSNYPVLGRNAYETATGVHAAAILKALDTGNRRLANRVYSGVPPDLVGLELDIAVGPMSGRSNVIYWLRREGIEPSEARVQKVLALAKSSSRCLSGEDIRAAVRAADRG